MLHYQHLHLFQITNNCLERAIFQMFSGGVRKPIFFPKWSTSVYHSILLLDFDIKSYCFRNVYIWISKFQTILRYVEPIFTKFKNILQFNMAACHIFRPLEEAGTHRLEFTETRNNIPDEARGPLLVQEFWPSKVICSPNPNSESYIY